MLKTTDANLVESVVNQSKLLDLSLREIRGCVSNLDSVVGGHVFH